MAENPGKLQRPVPSDLKAGPLILEPVQLLMLYFIIEALLKFHL
jgi:hypothetical protein